MPRCLKVKGSKILPYELTGGQFRLGPRQITAGFFLSLLLALLKTDQISRSCAHCEVGARHVVRHTLAEIESGRRRSHSLQMRLGRILIEDPASWSWQHISLQDVSKEHTDRRNPQLDCPISFVLACTPPCSCTNFVRSNSARRSIGGYRHRPVHVSSHDSPSVRKVTLLKLFSILHSLSMCYITSNA